MLLGEIYEKQGKVSDAGNAYQQALRNPELPVQNRLYIEQKIRALYKKR